ncbi:MAG: hypothetical protein RSE05_09335 [Clostridium sp.]
MSNLSEEEWKPCAYRCTYPGFIDCYQMASRIMERTNKNACMVSCTLVDADVSDSRKVIDRINQAFHSKESGSRVTVNYDITDIRE